MIELPLEEPPRNVNTATLLNDGRVLVIGTGGDVGNCRASAQLYDPITEIFTLTGTLPAGLPGYCRYAATLLRDGRVLVTSDDGSAQLYDPSTGRFARTGSMKNARQSYAATLLADGRVLVTGGSSAWPSPEDATVWEWKDLSSAELYDPTTGEFAPTGSMAVARWGHEAVFLNSGRVLVVGGSVEGGGSQEASAELYDPATGRFTPTGSTSTARPSPAAVLLRDGRVLVAGGWGASSAEEYDPATGVFAAIEWAEWASPAYLAPLADGRILVMAGEQQAGVDTGLYDPGTGALTPMGSRPSDCGHLAASLLDERVLFPGLTSFLYWP